MTKSNGLRPEISTISTSVELRRWYWLKKELSAEARRLGIKCSGAKFDILERLCHCHNTGNLKWPGDRTTINVSAFDWHSANLTAATIITDNYKNTQNMRRYFQSSVDPDFKFNIALMAWFKENAGKTLGDAAKHWLAQKAHPIKTKIKPHNQFNQYARDFIKDNPALGMKDARKYWALKKALPSETGRHEYDPNDMSYQLKNDITQLSLTILL